MEERDHIEDLGINGRRGVMLNLYVPVVARFKAWVCSSPLAGVAGSIPAGGAWMSVCCECCVFCQVEVSALS